MANDTPKLRILGVCGSLQQESSNLQLLHTASALAPPGVAFDIYTALADLPHFNPDLERLPTPPAVTSLREAVLNSDALLIAMPEYGHSLPGSLKNAIDWLIGSGELEGKVIAITSAVPWPERGRLGLAALRSTLAAVSAKVPFEEPITKGPEFEVQVSRLLSRVVAAAGG